MLNINPRQINGSNIRAYLIIYKYDNSSSYFIYKMCLFFNWPEVQVEYFDSDANFIAKVSNKILDKYNKTIEISGFLNNFSDKDEARLDANIDWIRSAYDILQINYRDFRTIREHFSNRQQSKRSKNSRILNSIENQEQNNRGIREPKIQQANIQNIQPKQKLMINVEASIENQSKTKDKTKDKQSAVQTKEYLVETMENTENIEQKSNKVSKTITNQTIDDEPDLVEVGFSIGIQCSIKREAIEVQTEVQTDPISIECGNCEQNINLINYKDHLRVCKMSKRISTVECGICEQTIDLEKYDKHLEACKMTKPCCSVCLETYQANQIKVIRCGHHLCVSCLDRIVKVEKKNQLAVHTVELKL